MPPNRKGAFGAVDNLETLQVSQFVDRGKFHPLTAAPVEATQAEPSQPVSIPKQQQHHEDPAKQAIIDRILLEEGLREQFSADHVIANLQKADEKTDLHRQPTDSDDYWAMTTPKDLSSDVRSKQTDASYWDWPTKTKEEEKNDLIQAILEQERIRQIFSVDHIVKNMQQEAAAVQQKKESLRPQNDSYWAWDSKAEDDVPVDKEETIRQILQDEKLRLQFSVETLENKLIQEKREDVVSRADPQNDDYWAGF